MKRILYLQHGEQDGPALFGRVMAECGVAVHVVHLWKDEAVPRMLGEFAGLVLGGGAMSAYQTAEYPFLEHEMALVKTARALNKPVLGMCLGAQIMAAAFGGNVYPNTDTEIGFHKLHFLPAADEDFLWAGFTAPFKPVHWHGDTFSLPPGAQLLATSVLTVNQLFCVDELHYGFQFHLEIDRPALRAMVPADDASLLAHGIDPVAFVTEGEAVLPDVERIGHAVFARWAGLLF